jgi:outer membrane protein assembly factor BamB
MMHTALVQLDGAVDSDPIVHNQLIVGGTIAGTLFALTPVTGRIIWSHRARGISVRGVRVAQDTLVATLEFGRAPSGKGVVTALDVTNGTELWTRRAAASIGTTPLITGNTVLHGISYPGFKAGGALVALSLADGKEIWTRDIAALSGTLLLVGDRLLVSSTEGAVWCLDPATADTRWSFQMQHQLAGSPAVVADTGFVGGFDHTLYALGLEDGITQWRFRARGPFRATPVISDGIVYIGSYDGHVYAVEAATGRASWQRDVGSEILTTALQTAELIIVGCSDATVHALDRRTGVERWCWAGPRPERGGVIAQPLLLDGWLHVFNRDGGLYLLDAMTGTAAAGNGGARANQERRAREQLPDFVNREDALLPIATPSGRVVACDPIADPAEIALDLALPPGPHQVLAIVTRKKGEEQVAALELRIDDDAVVEWRSVQLVNGEPARVGVDSAFAAFLDRNAALALLENADLVERFDEIDGARMSEDQGNDWSWAAAKLAAQTVDAVLCSSGHGDGVYDVISGWNRRGELQRVRIVFLD